MKTAVYTITDDPCVTLTSYLHEQSPYLTNCDIRPAVLVLPGGGYSFLSDREAEPIALAYMAEGYHAFVLRYSLLEKSVFPRPLNDAEAALEIIIANAEEWHVDPARIAVIGFSAGGHLAAALGTMGRVRPSALILCYPCILSSIGEVLANPVPSLDAKVTSKAPPAFLFSTTADTLVPVEHTLAFASALDRACVPFEAHIFQNGKHGLSLSRPLTSDGDPAMVDPRAAKWFGLSTDWLRVQWGDF